MFDNTHLPDMDKAIVGVLSILANVADVKDPKNHVYDVEIHKFRPKGRKKTSRIKKGKTNLELSLAVFFSSYLGLLLLALAVSKHHQKLVHPWSEIVVILASALLIIAMLSCILSLILMVVIVIISKKYSAQKMLNEAMEDAKAYQPVIIDIFATVKGEQQKLKFAESIIKALIIEEAQSKGKIISNLLPLLAPVIVLIIWLIFPIQLPGNTLLYNKIITILGLGTLTLPGWKFITELQSESLIVKFKKCLFLLEQTQLMINNIDQQVTPVASTKPRPKFGSASGLIEMSDDFDAPLADFDEYMP